jgi:hypothetical protein
MLLVIRRATNTKLRPPPRSHDILNSVPRRLLPESGSDLGPSGKNDALPAMAEIGVK